MALVVYNTLTRTKEEFKPLTHGKVGMYVCGPTVYDSCHLGHARHGVVWDTIRRYLEYAGFEVIYVVNITDIDDKIIKRASEEGIDWREVTARYIPEYLEDMASLRVRRPDYQPRATEHIADMIEAVKGLATKGHAYVVEGSVYFSVESFPAYGKLSGRSLDDETVSRVEPDERKRHPADFALWKASKEGEPTWESPWGPGRPGWHIECSVMSARYLGVPFDIHGGGEDLIFPHHENEIAQAEALTGETFVRYWLHNGFITVRQEKMSKSLGNQAVLRDVLRRYMPSTLRFFFVSAHYRSPVEFTHERLIEAANGLDRIYNCLEAVDRKRVGPQAPPTSGKLGLGPRALIDGERSLGALMEAPKRRFTNRMNDDFNTAGAIGQLFDMVNLVNTALAQAYTGPELDEAANTLRELMDVLGLPPERERPGSGELEDRLVELLVEVGTQAREAKQFAISDRIRDEMKAMGVELEDRLVALLVEVRTQAREAKQFAIADRIRDEMKAMGVELEDVPGGGSRVVRRVVREDE